MQLDGADSDLYKLVLRANTRTGAGIAANQEIVLNYGVQYNVDMGNPFMDEQTKKKYKTTVEAFFSKAAGLEDSQSQIVPEAVPQPVPAKASSGAPAPKAVPDSKAPPAKASPVPPPVAPQTAAASPGTQPPKNSSHPPPAPPQPKATVLDQLQPGAQAKDTAPTPTVSISPGDENLLKQMSDPPLEIKLEEGRLVITTLSEANRRLKPLTILCEFFRGKITPDAVPPGVPSFPFAISLKSLILDAGSSTFKTVESLIKEKSLTQIYMHEPFPQGVPPKELKPRASYLSPLP